MVSVYLSLIDETSPITMKLLYLIFGFFVLFQMVQGQSECICPALYRPVCSTAGTTYGNECQMLCEGETLDHEGSCVADVDKLFGKKE